MTQDQVKSELKDLRTLIGCKRDELLNKRYFELRDKYEIAIKQLEAIDQLIFAERIFMRRTVVQVGMSLRYSESAIRKQWRKITKQLAEMLTKPKTNFNRITESVEALARFIDKVTSNCVRFKCGDCEFNGICDLTGFEEWLQKECEQ